MTERTTCHRLQVADELYRFIQDEALPGSGVNADQFWADFDRLVHDLAPRNRELLAKRDQIQAQLDDWHRKNPGPIRDQGAYQAFLRDIGYLVDAPENVQIDTTNIDVEFSEQAGPQLVVPITNARYALNAANARWGSLYDALYGTDAIPEPTVPPGPAATTRCAAKKLSLMRATLDNALPLSTGSHADATSYTIQDGTLQVTLENGTTATLAQPDLLQGYRGDAGAPEAIVFKHHGLHLEIQIDREHPIGKQDKAGVKDVVLEAAVTTIMDCEDSVAAVDAEDKVLAYRNWLGLMTGELTEEVSKGGKTFTRKLNPDRTYTDLQGNTQSLHGRSMMLIRNGSPYDQPGHS